MKKVKLLIVFILLFSFCGGGKELSKMPPSEIPIADYEGIFSEKEYSNLLQIIDRIKIKYDVNVYLLTFYKVGNLGRLSTNNYKRYAPILDKEENRIFKLTVNDWWNKKIIIFTFSHHSRYNCESKSDSLSKLINEERWNEVTEEIIGEYYPKHEYYTAFKKMLKALENELEEATRQKVKR